MKGRIVTYLLAFIVVVLVYFLYKQNREVNFEKERRIEIQKKLTEDTNRKIEIIQQKNDSIIESLKEEVAKFSERTRTLNQRLKYYEKNPNIDLDFVSAFSIIAKSEYRPKE